MDKKKKTVASIWLLTTRGDTLPAPFTKAIIEKRIYKNKPAEFVLPRINSDYDDFQDFFFLILLRLKKGLAKHQRIISIYILLIFKNQKEKILKIIIITVNPGQDKLHSIKTPFSIPP